MDSFAKSFGVTSGVLIAILIVLGLCVIGGCFICLAPNIMFGILGGTPTP